MATRMGEDRAHALVVDPAITTTVHVCPTDRYFLVRVVAKGERYGLNDCMRHDEDDPMVEFYDLTYADAGGARFGPRGQFVSRYYLSNLAAPKSPRFGPGLLLHGNEPDIWVLDGPARARSTAFALAVTERAVPARTR